MPYEDKNCESLTNLALLDPTRWGWSAAGGIVDLCPPHERSRRRIGQRDFLNKQARERKKRQAKEKEMAKSKSNLKTSKIKASEKDSKEVRVPLVEQTALGAARDGSREKLKKEFEAAAKIVPIATATTAAASSSSSSSGGDTATVTKTISTSSSAILNQSTRIMPTCIPIPPSVKENLHGGKTNNNAKCTAIPTNMEVDSEPKPLPVHQNLSQTMDISTGNANVKANIVNAKAANNKGDSETEKAVAVDNIAKQAVNVNTVSNEKSSQISNQGQSKKKQKSLQKNNPQTTILQKYGLSETYNAIIKPKGRSKRDRFDLQVNPLREDGTVHPDAYHRGMAGEEARYKGRGNLLCDVKPTDTNHGLEEPNLKLDVRVEFPLCEPDWSDDEEEGRRDLEGQNYLSAPLRRNAKRGEPKQQFISETERRMKREERLAALPHFRDTVRWDLSNPKTPTTMVYASDIAAEFGLSLNRTLDLARSLQAQIDTFVRENVHYTIPISTKDPFMVEREETGLKPPKYKIPQLLHGGQCASNVSINTIAKKEVVKAVEPQTAENDVKAVCFNYEVEKPENLPKHDFDKLTIDPMYASVFLRRALEVNRATIRKLADGNIGKVKILENHSCHFCHIRRPKVVQYPCGNDAHCYCDLHTSRRFGYKVSQAKMLGIDYCPICTLQCTCYRCSGRVTTLVPQFAAECEEQGVGPEECDFNFVFHCSRALAKVAKRNGDTKATVLSTSTRRKTQASQVETVASTGEIYVVSKVPKEDFPAELSSGINKDPSRKDDYNTIFTPEGTTLCAESAKKSAKDEAKRILAAAVACVDGNVDFCHVCKEPGDLVCCDKCPRGFHGHCLTMDSKVVSGRWECPRCLDDSTANESDTMKGEVHLKKLLNIFQQYSATHDNFSSKVELISKIYDMIKVLMEYDFGDTFSEPVDMKLVRDYKTYVKRPMDLGTISEKMMNGDYCTTIKQRKDLIGADNTTDMDIIILKLLRDIEQIWHNCFLYNREGSSFHRMGQVLRRKTAVIRRVSFENDLDSFVRQNFDAFVEDCKVKREELSHSLKPWIPSSKYQINVPARGSANKRKIGIFDPATNMLVKQYTAFAAAFSVTEFLTRLGHKSEIKTNIKQKVKEHIMAMQDNPEILLFGYRWILMDNLRSGNFKLHKSTATVEKVCKVSKAVLAAYDTIEEAFQGWKDALGKSVGISQIRESDKTLDKFKQCFLYGESSIDGQVWVKTKYRSAANSIDSALKPGDMLNDMLDTAAEQKSSKQSPNENAEEILTRVMKTEDAESFANSSNIKHLQADETSNSIQNKMTEDKRSRHANEMKVGQNSSNTVALEVMPADSNCDHKILESATIDVDLPTPLHSISPIQSEESTKSSAGPSLIVKEGIDIKHDSPSATPSALANTASTNQTNTLSMEIDSGQAIVNPVNPFSIGQSLIVKEENVTSHLSPNATSGILANKTSSTQRNSPSVKVDSGRAIIKPVNPISTSMVNFEQKAASSTTGSSGISITASDADVSSVSNQDPTDTTPRMAIGGKNSNDNKPNTVPLKTEGAMGQSTIADNIEQTRPAEVASTAAHLEVEMKDSKCASAVSNVIVPQNANNSGGAGLPDSVPASKSAVKPHHPIDIAPSEVSNVSVSNDITNNVEGMGSSDSLLASVQEATLEHSNETGGVHIDQNTERKVGAASSAAPNVSVSDPNNFGGMWSSNGVPVAPVPGANLVYPINAASLVAATNVFGSYAYGPYGNNFGGMGMPNGVPVTCANLGYPIGAGALAASNAYGSIANNFGGMGSFNSIPVPVPVPEPGVNLGHPIDAATNAINVGGIGSSNSAPPAPATAGANLEQLNSTGEAHTGQHTQRNKTESKNTGTPARSAMEVEMAASLLDFAMGGSEGSTPLKKRPIEISGIQNNSPDSKRQRQHKSG